MKKKTSSQSLYVIFGVVIALLIALIGYFVYLLLAPSDIAPTTNTNAVVTNSTTTNATKETGKKKKNNANANVNSTTNDNANTTASDTTTPDANDGLVEPQPEETTIEGTDSTNEVVADEGEQVVTLYFAKSASSCGEVFAVKRAITPDEDLYGQILLAAMAGPTEEETGYTSAMPSGLRLRRVEYTGDGPVIYVNEAWSDADDCDQQTAKAQLVETANAMFDFPAGTSGEVIVGYPDDTETTEEETTEAETTE